jgi:hypothetical protein
VIVLIATVVIGEDLRRTTSRTTPHLPFSLSSSQVSTSQGRVLSFNVYNLNRVSVYRVA